MNKWDTIEKPNQLSDPDFDFEHEGGQELLNHILQMSLKKLDWGDFRCLFNGLLPAGNVVEVLYYFRQACTFVLRNGEDRDQICREMSGWVSMQHKELAKMGFLTLCLEELKPIWDDMINLFSRVAPSYYDKGDPYYYDESFIAMVSLLINVGQISFLNSFLREKIEGMNPESALLCSLHIRYYIEYINAHDGNLDYFFDHPTDIQYVFEEFPRFDFYLDKIRTTLLTKNVYELITLDKAISECSRATQPLQMCLLKEICATPKS